METSSSLYSKVGKISAFSEKGKIWGRIDIIREIIANCWKINSKTVSEVSFGFRHRWIELRIFEEPLI